MSSCYTSKFHGEKLLNRFQMAVIAKRLLAAVAPRPGEEDVAQLRALLRELREEIVQARTRVNATTRILQHLQHRVRRRRETTSWLGRNPSLSRKDSR